MIEQLNCVETIKMLRCYDMSNLLTTRYLLKILKKLYIVSSEFNVLDLADVINIYSKHNLSSPKYEKLISQCYNSLKTNIDDVCMEKMWEHIPECINNGKITVEMVEKMCETL